MNINSYFQILKKIVKSSLLLWALKDYKQKIKVVSVP